MHLYFETIFESRRKPPKEIILLIPGVGIYPEYYLEFCSFLSNSYRTILIYDYPLYRSNNLNAMPQWGGDNSQFFAKINSKYKNSKKIIISHSMGTILLGISNAYLHIDLAIIICGNFGNYRYFNHPYKLGMWLLAKVIPFTKILKYNSNLK